MAKTCCLCQEEILTTEYDLQKTFTSSSETSLWLVLQSSVSTELITNYLVCKLCYTLLDELDKMKLRVKSIEDKLKTYISKYKEHHQSEKKEQCSVCMENIDSKHLKTHLKTHELNEVETTFDFDEIHSISEIDSLGDVNLKECGERSEDTQKRETNNLKPHLCTMCPKTWKTLTELKNHMLSHSDERPFICEICGQAYKRQKALSVHVSMHKGINPYTCVYCKKSFTQKGALVRHTPIHTGETPFQCELCGKRFVHHTSFNIHKLSHTGQKSHKCEVCGLLLISGSHLKRHMRVHTGEKKFTCTVCGKKFAERYNLAVHEKSHFGMSTKRKKFKCHICNSLYNNPIKLEEHLLNVHTKYNPSEIS